MRLLDVLSAHAGDASLGDDALEELRVELQASAVWVHLVDPAGTLILAGERGLPAEIASCWRTLSTDAPELAARVFRSGQPAELRAASTGQAPSTDRSLLQLHATDARLRALPLCAQHRMLGVLSYTSTTATLAGGREQDFVALLSLALGQSVLLAAIARERDTLREVFEAAPAELLFVDASSGALLASRAYETLFQQTLDSARGTIQHISRLCWPDGRPLTHDELPSAKAVRGATTPDVELLVVRPDGARIPIAVRAAPVRDSSGRILGAVVAVGDLSANKQLLCARDELMARAASEKDRLSQIIESLPYGLIFVDAATGHLVVSRGMSELFGRKFEPDGGVRQKLGILCWPDGRLLTEDELPSMRVLRGEPLVEQEFVVARGDGRRIPVIERSSPVRDHEGNVVGAVIIYRDVSAQKEVDRLREEFAAMVAHDLRNPLQSMLLQINMLRKTVEEGKPPALDAFDRLMRSGARLSQMAGDLLDSARIELSRAHLDTAPLDVPQAVENIVERVRPTLGERRLTFEVHGRPPCLLYTSDAADE